jgi:hypothetical protein
MIIFIAGIHRATVWPTTAGEANFIGNLRSRICSSRISQLGRQGLNLQSDELARGIFFGPA